MRSIYQSLTCSLLLFAAVASAQPAEDARFLRLVHEYTLQSDGSVDYHHFRELKLESYFAFHREFGETFIVYDTLHERVQIRESHTLMADGRKVVTPANAFNEVLPRQATGAPAYSHLREMVITHTGLERGATIILDYVKKSFPGPVPFFSGAEEITADAPVNALTFILRHPAGSPFYYKLLNADVAPEVTTANGMTTYRWEFRSLPAGRHEVHAAPSSLPMLMWSTLNDHNAAWTSFTSQPAFALQCDADMKMFADSMRTAEPHPVRLSLKLLEHITNAVRDYALSPEHTAYGLRTPAETWHSGGGTALEKAALLAALCRAAGLDALPAMVTEATLFDPSLPVKQSWNHPLVQVRTAEHTYCLDPAGPNKAIAEHILSGRLILPIKPGQAMEPYAVPEMPARARVHYQLHLDQAGKITGEAELSLEGAANPYLALLKPGDKAATLGSIPGYQVEATEADAKVGFDRSTLKVKLQSIDTLPAFGGIMKLILPAFPLPMDILARTDFPTARRGDIRLPHGVDVSLTWDLHLPEGYSLGSGVEKDGGQTLAGKVEHHMTSRGNTWTIVQEAVIPTGIEQKLSREFRDMMGLWKAPHLTNYWVVPGE